MRANAGTGVSDAGLREGLGYMQGGSPISPEDSASENDWMNSGRFQANGPSIGANDPAQSARDSAFMQSNELAPQRGAIDQFERSQNKGQAQRDDLTAFGVMGMGGMLPELAPLALGDEAAAAFGAERRVTELGTGYPPRAVGSPQMPGTKYAQTLNAPGDYAAQFNGPRELFQEPTQLPAPFGGRDMQMANDLPTQGGYRPPLQAQPGSWSDQLEQQLPGYRSSNPPNMAQHRASSSYGDALENQMRMQGQIDGSFGNPQQWQPGAQVSPEPNFLQNLGPNEPFPPEGPAVQEINPGAIPRDVARKVFRAGNRTYQNPRPYRQAPPFGGRDTQNAHEMPTQGGYQPPLEPLPDIGQQSPDQLRAGLESPAGMYQGGGHGLPSRQVTNSMRGPSQLSQPLTAVRPTQGFGPEDLVSGDLTGAGQPSYNRSPGNQFEGQDQMNQMFDQGAGPIRQQLGVNTTDIGAWPGSLNPPPSMATTPQELLNEVRTAQNPVETLKAADPSLVMRILNFLPDDIRLAALSVGIAGGMSGAAYMNGTKTSTTGNTF
jgi:hypothetical protein